MDLLIWADNYIAPPAFDPQLNLLAELETLEEDTEAFLVKSGLKG